MLSTGKILNDETPLTEYNIDDKKFLVVMVCKTSSESQSDSKSGASTSSNTESENKTVKAEKQLET